MMKLFLSIVLFLSPILLFAQSYFGESSIVKKPLISITSTKSGPYIGLQKGKYTVIEFGAERIWKQIRLRDPLKHAAHMGFNYNFKYNVLGYDAGYWIRPNRIGLTYGGNIVFRTDFDKSKSGIAPVIGYKFWMLHLQTGYHFIARPSDFETNTFFISLRMGIINDRDIDIERRNKK